MTSAAPFSRYNTTEVLRTVTDHCFDSHRTGLSPSATTKQRPTLSHHSGRYKGRPSIPQHQPPGLGGTRSTDRAGISSAESGLLLEAASLLRIGKVQVSSCHVARPHFEHYTVTLPRAEVLHAPRLMFGQDSAHSGELAARCGPPVVRCS